MMAQNDLVVVGIDVAKDKVDACIRSLPQRQTFPSTAQGRRQLTSWLRKHKVGKAAMEASGGYEREGAGHGQRRAHADLPDGQITSRASETARVIFCGAPAFARLLGRGLDAPVWVLELRPSRRLQPAKSDNWNF
jgi:hypothetical protein